MRPLRSRRKAVTGGTIPVDASAFAITGVVNFNWAVQGGKLQANFRLPDPNASHRPGTSSAGRCSGGPAEDMRRDALLSEQAWSCQSIMLFVPTGAGLLRWSTAASTVASGKSPERRARFFRDGVPPEITIQCWTVRNSMSASMCDSDSFEKPGFRDGASGGLAASHLDTGCN